MLAPPAGALGVIGLDPGLRTGCKIAVVDETGKFLDHGVIYPLEPKNDVDGAARLLKTLVDKYNVRAIAIGNGTGSRESSAFVTSFLRDAVLPNVFSVVVNESGASVYSASEIARQEFPDSGSHGSRSYLDCSKAAGPAGGVGEDRSEVHRGRPVSARRRSAPAWRSTGKHGRDLRQSRRR